MSFIFNQDEPWSYDQLQSKRKIAQSLMSNRSAPRNVGEGLHAIGNALLARGINKRADAREAELKSDFDARFGDMAPNANPDAMALHDHPMASTSHKKILSALMDGAPQYRYGTQFHPGGKAVVGEDGPEVVDLPRGAKVQPNPSTFAGGDYQVADLDAFKLMQQQPEYEKIEGQKLTEGQAKTLAYLRRAMFADAAMQDPRLAKAMTKMDNNIAGDLGALGRMYTDDDYELGKLMAEQFASAILRRDSGAQTPDPEVRRYMKQFFPLTGETDEQLAAKKSLRREEIRGLEMALGNASTLGDQIRKEIQEMIDASQMDEASSGISDEDKAFLKSLGIE